MPGTARASGPWISNQCLTNCSCVIPSLRTSSEMALITGASSSGESGSERDAAPGHGPIPLGGGVVVEDQGLVSAHADPVSPIDLSLELGGGPARVADGEQDPARRLPPGHRVQDGRIPGEGDAVGDDPTFLDHPI